MTVVEKDRVYNCVIIPNGYWEGFHLVSNIIEQQLNIKFKHKLDDFDSYYWIFDFEGLEVNLHYHEMIGDVELFVSKDKKENIQLLTSLSGQLKKHLH